MRKLIAVIVLIGLVVVFYIYTGNKMDNKADKENDVNDSSKLTGSDILQEVKEDYDAFLSEVKRLQGSPDQIAELNCMITQILYSGGLSEDETLLLFKLQRSFYTEETLKNNPEDENYEKLLQEIQSFKDSGLNIIGYEIVGPQYVDIKANQNQMIIFNVIYYLNITGDAGEVYKGYIYQQNDDKLWELKGFGTINEFPVVKK